jgi:hypothetical protein
MAGGASGWEQEVCVSSSMFEIQWGASPKHAPYRVYILDASTLGEVTEDLRPCVRVCKTYLEGLVSC